MLKDKSIRTVWKWRHIVFWFHLQSQIKFRGEKKSVQVSSCALVNPTAVTATSAFSSTRVTSDTRARCMQKRAHRFSWNTKTTKLSPWVTVPATHRAIALPSI